MLVPDSRPFGTHDGRRLKPFCSSEDAPGIMGVFCGQHSIVICPAVTGPLPWILNVTKRASGSVRLKPLPAVRA